MDQVGPELAEETEELPVRERIRPDHVRLDLGFGEGLAQLASGRAEAHFRTRLAQLGGQVQGVRGCAGVVELLDDEEESHRGPFESFSSRRAAATLRGL